MKRKENELIEYLVLLLGMVMFFLLLIIFRYENFALKLVAMLGSLFYVAWGVIHHAADERLTRGVVAEYFFIGSMVFLLFYLVLSV
jgi:hypothetical protein